MTDLLKAVTDGQKAQQEKPEKTREEQLASQMLKKVIAATPVSREMEASGIQYSNPHNTNTPKVHPSSTYYKDVARRGPLTEEVKKLKAG